MQHIALQNRQREIDETRRSLAEQLGRLEARHNIPTLDSLVAARGDRERGWQIVLKVLQHSAQDSDEVGRFVECFPPAHDLLEAYVRSVSVTDQLADRLLSEAELVASKSKLLADAIVADERIAKLEAERAKITADRQDFHADWEDVWQDLQVTVQTPREMRPWRNKQQAIARDAAHLRERQSGSRSDSKTN